MCKYTNSGGVSEEYPVYQLSWETFSPVSDLWENPQIQMYKMDTDDSELESPPLKVILQSIGVNTYVNETFQLNVE